MLNNTGSLSMKTAPDGSFMVGILPETRAVKKVSGIEVNVCLVVEIICPPTLREMISPGAPVPNGIPTALEFDETEIDIGEGVEIIAVTPLPLLPVELVNSVDFRLEVVLLIFSGDLEVPANVIDEVDGILNGLLLLVSILKIDQWASVLLALSGLLTR
jgi:hypothetical protein